MRGENGGPKTTAGKKRSSRNSERHGILSARAVVINGIEDPRDFERHRAEIFDSLQPEGHLEYTLAELVAWTLWKLIRTAYYQAMTTHAGILDVRRDLSIAAAYEAGTLSKGEYPELDEADVDLAKAVRILPGGGTLDKIIRYEAHLHRQYIQTLHELEAIQARRHGERTPLTRLDITGSPS